MNPSKAPQLADLLRSGAGSSANLVERLISASRQHLRANVSFLSEFRDGRKIIRSVSGTDGPREGDSFPLDETFCYRVTRGELPVVVNDARSDERVKDLEITSQLNIGSYIGVPVHLPDGRLYGTLCCVSSEPDHTLHERDSRFMRVMAEILSEQLAAEETAAQAHDQKVARIRDVIDQRRARVVFQPIVDLVTGAIVGAEALSRFEVEPRRPPDLWFAEAWDVGLGPELEVATVRAAVAQFGGLPDRAYLSLNLSPETMQQWAWRQDLGQVPAERLVIEVTEHTVVGDYKLLLDAVSGMRKSGIRIAVDDVGAGYSGLSHILRVSPDIVKLDTSLTANIHRDLAKQALASAVTSFAARTNAGVVAEGIECAEDARSLRELGVACGQGYYFAKPGALPLRVTGTV